SGRRPQKVTHERVYSVKPLNEQPKDDRECGRSWCNSSRPAVGTRVTIGRKGIRQLVRRDLQPALQKRGGRQTQELSQQPAPFLLLRALVGFHHKFMLAC